ncbi:Integral membrane protein [Neofusicoccum parvum]|nr:Integral membrane protein [Neofusicoccum parvum]
MASADIESAIADGRVPAGISAEYLEASKDAGARAGILVIFVITMIVTAARLYARAVDPRGLVLEDYLIILTAILFIVFIALCLELLTLGSGRHIEYIQYVLPFSTVNATEVEDFAAHIIYTTALYICRISGLSFYRRLCARHPSLELAVKISFALITAGYLPQILLIIFHCRPVTGLWPYTWQPEHAAHTCTDWGIVYLTNSIISLASDFILFIIPIALIAIYRGSLANKIKLSVVLIPGILVIAISITRLYLVTRGWVDPDMSWAYGPMLAIETAEIGGTVIALSAPALKVYLGRLYQNSSLHGSSKTRTAGNRYGAGTGRGDVGTVELDGLRRGARRETWVGAGSGAASTEGSVKMGGEGRGSEEDLLFEGGGGRKEGGVKVTMTIATTSEEVVR